MSIFGLLFILLFLTMMMSLFLAAWNALPCRRDTALWILQRVAMFVAVHLSVVITVGLASPRKIIPAGLDLCADEWCIAVVKTARWPHPDSGMLAVTVRVSSRAKRDAQARTAACTDCHPNRNFLPPHRSNPQHHANGGHQRVEGGRVIATDARVSGGSGEQFSRPVQTEFSGPRVGTREALSRRRSAGPAYSFAPATVARLYLA